jgi:hypothetical protein
MTFQLPSCMDCGAHGADGAASLMRDPEDPNAWICRNRDACRARTAGLTTEMPIVKTASAEIEHTGRELAAIAMCSAAFDHLDAGGRRRVLAYLTDMYTPRPGLLGALLGGQR